MKNENTPSTTVKKKASKSKRQKRKPGYSCALDVDAPYGLFEAVDSDWYLVTADADWKFAIVLAHSDLPSFTTIRLKPTALAFGNWWGAFHVSADQPIHDLESREVGMLSDETAPALSLRCHTPLVYTQWLDVGRVTELREDYDTSDYHGIGTEYASWTIFRTCDGLPIVTRSEDGSLKRGGPVAVADEYVSHMRVKPYRVVR